jgi:predicted dehydrogenase
VTLRVGLLGCGDVAVSYVTSSRAYDSYEIVACAARDASHARAFGDAHGLEPLGVDELLARDDVDAVLNLTPVDAHHDLTSRALASGKHVYSEKALAATVEQARSLVAQADAAGLRLACAPDIVLGPAYERVRELLPRIGEPVAVKAAFLEGGPEERHPNPDIFYGPNSGPLLDMGPYYVTAIASLFGPVRRVAGIASTRRPEREIATGPRAGERFAVQTATHVAAVLELEGGATADLVTSYEAPGQYVARLAVAGTAGTIELPDPNWHGGTIRLGDEALEVPSTPADFRGPGVDDLARALAEGRPHRASAELALHILEVLMAIRAACASGMVRDVDRGWSGT